MIGARFGQLLRYSFNPCVFAASFAVSVALFNVLVYRGGSDGVQSQLRDLEPISNTTRLEEPGYDSASVPTSSSAAGTQSQRPVCTDRRLKPLWDALLHDEEFAARVAEVYGESDCRNMFKIFRVDINRDGKKEIFLWGTSLDLCGGVGNCWFGILENVNGSYRVLLSSSDYIDRSNWGDQILRTSTRGYSDILLKGHFSASETSFTYYKYDGGRYRESKCLYELPIGSKGGNPVWGFITCKEFSRRIDAEIAANDSSP